jgi:phage I-like protein
MTRDAIEHLKAVVTDGTLSTRGTNYQDTLNAMRAVLAELDRLRKPVENGEVAECLVRLRRIAGTLEFDSSEIHVKSAILKNAADLIERLARERDELQQRVAELTISITAYERGNTVKLNADAAVNRAVAAEARAARIISDLTATREDDNG